MAGKKSSNGKYLFTICRENNPNSYYVNRIEDIDTEWLKGVESVGISGATSTPQWLMEMAAEWSVRSQTKMCQNGVVTAA